MPEAMLFYATVVSFGRLLLQAIVAGYCCKLLLQAVVAGYCYRLLLQATVASRSLEEGLTRVNPAAGEDTIVLIPSAARGPDQQGRHLSIRFLSRQKYSGGGFRISLLLMLLLLCLVHIFFSLFSSSVGVFGLTHCNIKSPSNAKIFVPMVGMRR